MMLVCDTRDSVVCVLYLTAQRLRTSATELDRGPTCREDPSLSLPQENYPTQQDVVTHAHNIFALEKMRQEDRCKFEDSSGYLLRPYFNMSSPHLTKQKFTTNKTT